MPTKKRYTNQTFTKRVDHDGGRHREEHRGLPRVVLAGTADGLVRLGGDGQERVQRMELGRHVAGRDEAVDAVRVATVVQHACGVPHHRIARDLGVTESRVSQLLGIARQRLRAEAGIELA